MSRGIRYGIEDFYGKEDAPLWLTATKPQLVVEGRERSPHA
jgi:hypothetical protein